MPYRPFEGQNCSIAAALAVIGERWTLLVMRELSLGHWRFEEIRRETGIASNILSDRLQTLVEHGVVERRPYGDAQGAWEYVPTRKGLDAFPVLLALIAWGDRHYAGERGAPRVAYHTRCGSETAPEVVCSECGEPIDALEVRMRPGPGATPEQVAAGELPSAERLRAG